MKQMTINGRLYEVYTAQDWWHDGDLKVQVGQVVEPYIYFDLLGDMTPTTNNGTIFQPGEPYSHESGKALYMTFERMEGVDGRYYKYVGLQPAMNHD